MCSCGKRKVGSQPRKIVKTQQTKSIGAQNNILKRIIKRTAY